MRLLENPKRMEAAVLGGIGFAYGYIAKETRLSKGEVAYAIAVAGSKPTLYRNGKTKLSRVVREQVGVPAAKLVEHEIDKMIQRTLKL